MLNYLNGVETEIGKIFGKRKAKKQEMLVKNRALIKKAIAKKNVTSQVQKANILNKAIKKASLVKKASPLTITRIKKQAVIDMNRKNFEEEGEPIVTELPMPILETANDKFDEGLEEIQEPENLNPDEADSDEGGEEIGRIGKGKLKKRLQKSGYKIFSSHNWDCLYVYCSQGIRLSKYFYHLFYLQLFQNHHILILKSTFPCKL